ncbi:ABC transporter ATP-binding protein [Ligilactobacillus equi]
MVAKQIVLEFQHVVKKYGSQVILPDLSFTVREGEFITILGSSGSGKTTTLKLINHLIEPTQGKILLKGQDSQALDLIALRRQMGYVVQSIGLFPHMTVAENIATVPKLLKWSSPKIEQRVKELLELVQLDPEKYQKRYPRQLSGGQQQRVGVARALAANPEFVLFDEPFGAIDALTRLELQKQLKTIHQSLGQKTFLLVTHDIAEAFYLGDRVMIMHEGKIEAFDKPQEIIQNPPTPFVQNLMATVKAEQKMWEGLE